MPATQLQIDTLKVYRDNNENFRATARTLGKNESTIRSIVRKALKWEEASVGQKQAVEHAGLDIEGAKHGWRVIVHADGSRDSVFWKAGSENDNPINLATLIKEAMQDIAPAVPLPLQYASQPDIISVFPVADLHIGLLTDEEEVGHDWDTKKAMRVFEETFGKLVANTPASETAILAQLGDLTHNDDQRNITPQSGHQLDVDSRYFMIVRRAIAIMKWGIDLLRQKYQRVVYRGCRGNHDMTTHIAVTLALAEHYQNVPEVEIIDSASEFYAHEFGKNMFFFHHGDKAKPERILPFIANEYPEIWGRTKHRVAFSGHVHHEWAKEMAGMLFRSIGTIIPRDVHAYSHGYGSNRCLMSFTYDRDQGEIASARINL